MRINLGNTPLFRGMTVPDIEEMLRCLRAAERTYKKGAVILPEGTPTEQLGVVLSGRVIIEMGDVWGNNSVLSSVGAGGIFAEAYACAPGEPLMVNVTAAEDTEVLLLHIGQVLEPCAKVCPRHLRLLRNLLTLSEFAAFPPGAAHLAQVHPQAAAVLFLGVHQAHRQL